MGCVMRSNSMNTSSLNWQSDGLQNRRLKVRFLPGMPNFLYVALIAQLVERRVEGAGVRGSIPRQSTKPTFPSVTSDNPQDVWRIAGQCTHRRVPEGPTNASKPRRVAVCLRKIRLSMSDWQKRSIHHDVIPSRMLESESIL